MASSATSAKRRKARASAPADPHLDGTGASEAVIPRYRFSRELGTGSFGRVYLAHDLATGAHVAVKLLHRTDDESKVRLAREIRVLRDQINNRHVVDVLDFDLDHDPPYVVMEYCEYGSLRRAVGKLGWRHVVAALSHATLGLHGIHAAGGFHRDIKPDNLLLARDADGAKLVKVGDFGLARVPHLASSNMTRSAWGTPGYVAPEIISGAAFEAAADIYSLGVTAIELLTGDRAPAALEPADCPESFRVTVKRMTSAIPAARPDTYALGAQLRALAELREPPAPARREQAATGSGGGGAFMAGLALAGLAGLALAGLAGRDDRAWDANVRRYRDSDGRFTE